MNRNSIACKEVHSVYLNHLYVPTKKTHNNKALKTQINQHMKLSGPSQIAQLATEFFFMRMLQVVERDFCQYEGRNLWNFLKNHIKLFLINTFKYSLRLSAIFSNAGIKIFHLFSKEQQDKQRKRFQAPHSLYTISITWKWIFTFLLAKFIWLENFCCYTLLLTIMRHLFFGTDLGSTAW